MSRQYRFIKMQGCGNDYIFPECTDGMPHDPGQLSVRLSDRHFGIGGDGVVFLLPSDNADVRMRIFNRDGSEGRVCGTALMCVCKHIYNRKTVENFPLKIETLAGIRRAEMLTDGRISVQMGELLSSPQSVPVCLEGDTGIDRNVLVGGVLHNVCCVSVGNPHCVLWVADTESADVSGIGASIEKDPIFPQGTNVEFVQCLGNNRLRVRVWERGSGETLACGTGACAAAGVAVKLGKCDAAQPVTVSMPGGVLEVRYCDGMLCLVGEVHEVFTGTVTM